MENWKDIAGYVGWYQVSDMGRVRSLDRTVYFKDNKGSRDYKGKILKEKYHNGYPKVNLLRNKEIYTVYVHKLVVDTFLPEDNERKWINHINGIKSDNRLSNLERCTPFENTRHAVEMGLKNDNVSGLIEYADTLKKKVICLRNNKVIYKADCSRDMAKLLVVAEHLENVKLETIGRSIRNSAANGTPYKGYQFQYIEL